VCATPLEAASVAAADGRLDVISPLIAQVFPVHNQTAVSCSCSPRVKENKF